MTNNIRDVLLARKYDLEDIISSVDWDSKERLDAKKEYEEILVKLLKLERNHMNDTVNTSSMIIKKD